MLLDSSLPLMWMHTFFMRFAIDIVFLDRSRMVRRICTGLKPWRFSPVVAGARLALELPVGSVQHTATQPGDLIIIRAVG